MTARVWPIISRVRSLRSFGASVLILLALLLSPQLALAQFTQQGPKLVGTGAVGNGWQGTSVALSADGNTAIVGGPGSEVHSNNDNNSQIGAAWVYTRANGVWTQQGDKLVGAGASGLANQGRSVALSADGNTAIVGGPNDSAMVGFTPGAGAVWAFTRSNGVWTQQGDKLVGAGAMHRKS
jgi:hypothetical protein